MDFNNLKELVPYVIGQKKHIVTMNPYNAITLALPGKHQNDTSPPGGDFVVMVSDDEINWINHQFTHGDIFTDIKLKRDHNEEWLNNFFSNYVKVVFGEDPEKFDYERGDIPGLHPETFLYAVQCLALAEHRRYPQHEAKGGGRFLPARFAAGIVYGFWTVENSIEVQRKGRPGVEWLEKQYGKPPALKELINE